MIIVNGKVIHMTRYDKVKGMINRGVKVDEKSGQKILGWSPNNVKRLIVGPDAAIVQFHCAASGTKYSRLVEFTKFSREEHDRDLDDIRNMKYKSILKVLTDGRICSCVEEIIVCGVGCSQVSKYDANINALQAKGCTALETRFPRLDSIMVYDDTVTKFLNVLSKGSMNVEVLTKYENKYMLLNEVIAENKNQSLISSMHVVYKRNKKDWWSGSYLRPNIYNMDSENGPIYRKFADIRNYYIAKEREEKLEATYKDNIIKAVNDKNIETAFDLIEVAVRSIDDIMKKASVQDKLLWLNQIDDSSIKSAIEFNIGDKELDCNVIMALEDMKKYYNNGAFDENRFKIIIGATMEKWKVKWGRKKLEPAQRAKNIESLRDMLCNIALSIICCEYSAIIKYILSGNSDTADELNAEKVSKCVKECNKDKLTYCEVDDRYCRIQNNGSDYKKYLKMFAENNGGTGHTASGVCMFDIIKALI